MICKRGVRASSSFLERIPPIFEFAFQIRWRDGAASRTVEDAQDCDTTCDISPASRLLLRPCRINYRIVTRFCNSTVICSCTLNRSRSLSALSLDYCLEQFLSEKFRWTTKNHGASHASCRKTQWSRGLQTSPHESGPGPALERTHHRHRFVLTCAVDMASEFRSQRAWVEALQQNLRPTTAPRLYVEASIRARAI